ncbi:DUF7847 domain-containing protein [Streptomyces goshikiensis]|uniref:DUF7847 domain-containing protein n=1 Tax=Streptomyces goshikiensis TaxID=1942 RepID=UPI00367DB4A5
MTQNTGWGPAGQGPGGPGAGWGGAPQWGAWQPRSPQPGVIPLRPLNLAEILSGTFETMRRHWKQLVGVMLAVQAITLPVMALAVAIAVASVFSHFEPVFDPPFGEDPTPEHVVPLLVAGGVLFVVLCVIGVLATAVMASLCPAVLREAVMGRPTTFRTMWRAAFRRAPAVAGATLLSILIAGAPVFAVLAVWVPLLIATASEHNAPLLVGLLPMFLLVAAPLAVWLGIRFSLAPAAVVMEGASPVTALRRSAALVRGDWWRIFGVTLVAGMVAGAVSWVIQLPFQTVGMIGMIPAMAGVENGSDATPAGLIAALGFAVVAMAVGGVASQTFQIAFTQLAAGMLYVDQRIRREGLADAILAEVGAPAPAAAPTAPAAPAAPPRPESPEGPGGN